MGVGLDPVPCPLIHESFNKCVLAVCKNSNKQPAVCHFAGIGIDDMCRITCPVDFDLLTGFSGYVHGRTPFLLIFVDVLAELGIHERVFTGKTAFLTVFNPQ